MAGGSADGVEGDFEDEVGFDVVFAAVFAEGVALEVLGEFFDFVVGEAAVGFADDAEGAGVCVADGEGVRGEDVGSVAMALLGDGDDAIEGGHDAFEFEPCAAATAGGVWAGGVFGDEAFVAIAEGLFEVGIDLGFLVSAMDGDDFEGRGEDEGVECGAALGEGGGCEVLIVFPKEVEGDVAKRDGGGAIALDEEEVGFDGFSSEAFLEVGEAEFASIGVGDEFAIEDEVSGDLEGGADEFGEFGVERAEVAREEGGTIAVFVELGADAVVFGFEPVWGGEGDGGEVVVGQRPVIAATGQRPVIAVTGGEHGFDGDEGAEGGVFESAKAGEDGGFADIAGEHVGLADGGRLGLVCEGDGFFDEAFAEADAEVAGEEFDEGFAFDGVEGAESLAEEFDAGE